MKIGYGRCKAICVSHKAANALVNNDQLVGKGYVAKILPHFIGKMGIIFNIPPEIEITELEQLVDSPVKILKMIRVTKRNNQETINTTRVKILFHGTTIPSQIDYAYTKVPVRHYIHFSQCFKCYRFGHFAMHCKANYNVCNDCYNKHEQDDECSDLACTNCGLPHKATDRNCPARRKAYAVQKIMTLENLSKQEVKNTYPHLFNRFEGLDEENYTTNFPKLPSKNNRNKVIDNNVEAAQAAHSVGSYAKAAKKRQTSPKRQPLTNADKAIIERNLIIKAVKSDHVPIFEKCTEEATAEIAKFLRDWSNDELPSAAREFLNKLKAKLEKASINNDAQLILTNGGTKNTAI